MYLIAKPTSLQIARPAPHVRHVLVHAGPKGKGSSGSSSSSIPPWKRYQKKGLGKQAEATLESVWQRTQWPSDETISGMWDLHKVRREQVIAWFSEKRKAVRGGNSSKGIGNGKMKGNSETERAPITDWDAEWGVSDVAEEFEGNITDDDE